MRTFIAIHFSSLIKQRLGDAQQLFAGVEGKIAWTRPSQMHLTVKFLGDVPNDSLDKLSKLVSFATLGIAPFTMNVRGLGAFGPLGRQLRVIFASISDPPPGLTNLYQRLNGAFTDLNIVKEERPFTPHVTIARVTSIAHADACREIITNHAALMVGPQHVTSISLMRSDLGPNGSIYTELKSFDLPG
jgi:2'-5' RNA ligase